MSWVPSSDYGDIDYDYAIEGGRTTSGEVLYIGRAHYKGSLMPGKVQPSHQTLYIGFGGHEISLRDFETLVGF